MEWGTEITTTEEGNNVDVEHTTKPCPPTSSTDIHPIEAGYQQQPQIKIAISEEMRSLYHILLGAVASLVNTATPSTTTNPSASCTPTSVPMRHLLDILHQPECGDGQDPNLQLLRTTLITSLCTTSTTNMAEEGGEDGR